MHFLYASEAVNKLLINVLDLFKKDCIYFQKGLSLNLLSADEECNNKIIIIVVLNYFFFFFGSAP